MIEHFHKDDEKYFIALEKYLLNKNTGYVFNHFTNGPDTDYNKLLHLQF